MTREEAIKRLKEIDIRDALQEDYDALYMAIEALEQEPTTHGYMLVCPNCGLDVHSDFKNCPRCGARMESEEI